MEGKLIESPGGVPEQASKIDMSHLGHLLLVEDDYDVADNLTDFLGARGFAITHAPNGPLALNELIDGSFDAIILDINLPGIDGISLCERLRRDDGRRVPVLMLTAADALEDKLEGFAAGADDYVVKPFSLCEVEARIRALISRSNAIPLKERGILKFGEIELDSGQMKARFAGTVVNLTAMGFRILEVLVKEAPNIVSRTTLETVLWNGEPPGSDALRSHIFALRKALETAGATKQLTTVRGIGYQLIGL